MQASAASGAPAGAGRNSQLVLATLLCECTSSDFFMTCCASVVSMHNRERHAVAAAAAAANLKLYVLAGRVGRDGHTNEDFVLALAPCHLQAFFLRQEAAKSDTKENAQLATSTEPSSR